MNIKKAIVIGNGSIAACHRKNLKKLFPKLFIVSVPASGTVINKDIESSDNIILDLNEAIKGKADIAIVASPSPYHAMHTKLLLMAGIPSLIEKPVTNNLQDARELIKIQSETGIPVSIGYCLRYLPSTIMMKELIDQRVIGKIYNSFVSVGQYLPDWRKTKEYKNSVSAKKSLGGGALFELSHEIDYIQWMLGSLKVHYAHLRSTSELNLEVEELADIILVSNTGSVCNIHLDFLQKKANRTCSFIGEKGRLDWDLITNKIKLHKKDSSEILLNERDWDSNQMYISLLKDFLELVAGNKNSTINLNEATKTVELIENIKKCAIQGIKQ